MNRNKSGSPRMLRDYVNFKVQLPAKPAIARFGAFSSPATEYSSRSVQKARLRESARANKKLPTINAPWSFIIRS